MSSRGGAEWDPEQGLASVEEKAPSSPTTTTASPMLEEDQRDRHDLEHEPASAKKSIHPVFYIA